jgi:hypothetical protein
VITYAERVCFSQAALRLLLRVEAYVESVSRDWGNELRCHELARAVHIVAYEREREIWSRDGGGKIVIVVVDGHCGPVDHSWLCCSDGVILDAYAPGRLPAVQLVDPLIGRMYRPGPVRQDIRQPIVDRLVVEMCGA